MTTETETKPRTPTPTRTHPHRREYEPWVETDMTEFEERFEKLICFERQDRPWEEPERHPHHIYLDNSEVAVCRKMGRCCDGKTYWEHIPVEDRCPICDEWWASAESLSDEDIGRGNYSVARHEPESTFDPPPAA